MIPRYSREILTDIWSDQSRYQIWLDLEIAACEAMHIIGIVPSDDLEKIQKNAKFSLERIAEIELETKHDIIAFTTSVAESLGNESRFIHKGLTSSDVLDTSLSIQIKKATDIILDGLTKLLEALKKKSYKYKDTICIGRSHGVHAEPITFGMKMARFYKEFERNKKRLLLAVEEISICKMSGAVGTYANIDVSIEEYVASKFNLKAEDIASQVIPRDRHANYIMTLSLIASSIENISTEVRNLQKSEVLEVEESFSKNQKGSSAMPHKKNPILSENLTGIARMIRSYTIPALENVTLWHERDISHSSVERIILPDATILLDFAITRLTGLVENLVVHEENMVSNMNKLNGLFYSQRALLFLINKGITREEAYKIIQKSAMESWKSKASFKTLLKNNVDISEEELNELFNEKFYIKNIDFIFQKVFDTDK